jgi:shikimate dehydrogenase
MTDKLPGDVYGVLGYPVKHSLSPLMHNAAFSALKVNAQYRLFEKSPEEIPGFLLSLAAEHIKGINVTVPHKERVIPFLSRITDEAGLIGAVNTIKVTPGGLEGFNTDGIGFIRHLKEDLAFYPSGKRAVVLGAGGASKAVSVYLAKEGVCSITLFDIDKQKAGALTSHLKDNFSKVEVKNASSPEHLDLKNADLLVNATPIGMKESDPTVIGEQLIPGGILVYDLIYNPGETKLLKTARSAGAKVSNGLGMLLYQGMASFEIWTGLPAPKEVMRQALVNSA